MKTAYILGKFPEVSETFILYEILEARKHNLDVKVFAFLEDKKKIMHVEAGQVDVTYLVNAGNKRVLCCHLFWLLKNPARYFRAFLIAMKEESGLWKLFITGAYLVYKMWRFGPDLIHVHFATYPADFAMLCSLLTGVPFTFTAHRYDIFDTPPGNYKLKSSLALKHVTVSAYNKKYICEKFGIPEGRVAVIHCGVRKELLSENRPPAVNGGCARIVTVARLEKEKNIPALIEAARILNINGYPCRFTLVGDGRCRNEIEAMLEKYGLRHMFRLTGFLPNNEVLSIVRSSDLFVLTSKSEGIPVAMMEAMAVGTPVIAPRITGIPELVDSGRSGFLLDPQDPALLAGLIAETSDNKELCAYLTKNAKTKIENEFLLSTEVAKLVAIWRQGIVPAYCGSARLKKSTAKGGRVSASENCRP